MSAAQFETLTCEIHPLVIASAYDHYARVTMGGSKLPKTAPVYGLLFGGINNHSNVKTISIRESTDAIYDLDGNGLASFPRLQIEKKIALWTAVFTDYKLIGWYAFGDKVHHEHLRIHKKYVSIYAENPIFLLIRKDINVESDQLPMVAYTADVDTSSSDGASSQLGQPQILIEVPFSIQSSSVEKISMDTVMTSIPSEGLSSLEVENDSVLSSIRQLNKRLEIVASAMQLFRDDKIPRKQELIRKASKVCKMLSKNRQASLSGSGSGSGSGSADRGVVEEKKSEFNRQFESEITTDVMVAFLAAATKGNSTLSEVADSYALVFGDRSSSAMGGGGGGSKAF